MTLRIFTKHTGGGSEALYTSDGGYSGFMVMVAIESGWCSFSITILFFIKNILVSCARVFFNVLYKSAPSERRLDVGAPAVVGPAAVRDGNCIVGMSDARLLHCTNPAYLRTEEMFPSLFTGLVYCLNRYFVFK